MTRRVEFWELAGWAAAVGGAAVWGLAAAAREGWLRALLDLYPKSSWERVTWVLIPMLLLLPLVAQGVGGALLSSSRPIAAGRGIVGSVAGSLLAVIVGAALFAVLRRLPGVAGGSVARVLPVLLVLGYCTLLLAGLWLAACRSPHRRRWRPAAIPFALAGAAALWIAAREWVLLASFVLARAEAAAMFIAVAAGGGAGTAGALRSARPRELTGVERGRYNGRS